MGRYSIKDLEKLSGIKAHTIRIWEKRYSIISPDRTNTNIRTYCDCELKKLLNIAILNNHGFKISKIAKLTHEDICSELERLNNSSDRFDDQIDTLVVAMVDLDRRKFERVLADSTLKIGFEDTCISLLYPFLQKIGVMWQTDDINPAQEHFMSNLIIQKMYVAIDQAYQPDMDQGRKALFFLPEGEYHELGLLFFRYLMKKRGYETIYLGQSVPFEDLLQIVEAHSPSYLVTAFVASGCCENITEYLNKLSSYFPDKQIIVSGYQVCHMQNDLPEKITKVQNIAQFIEHIEL